MCYFCKPIKKFICNHIWIGRRNIPLLRRPIKLRTSYGAKIWAHPNAMGCLYLQGKYEAKAMAYLQNYLTKDMICIDVGANEGYYTILMAKRSQWVYAFEPIESNIEKLQANLRLNSIENYSITPAAIGKPLESVEFKVVEGYESRASYGPTLQKDIPKGSVTTFTSVPYSLDSFKLAPNVLKIDVEGAERYVLAGAVKTIKSHRPLIIIEIAEVATQAFNYKAQVILNQLKVLHYKLLYEPKMVRGSLRDTVVALPQELPR